MKADERIRKEIIKKKTKKNSQYQDEVKIGGCKEERNKDRTRTAASI